MPLFTQLFGHQPLFLAPMAGVTNLPFRLFCRELGATAAITEFVSVLSMTYGSDNNGSIQTQALQHLLATTEDERPVGLQVFGFCHDHFDHWLTKMDVKELGFDFLELNVGCPVPKVIRSGSGAALLAPDKLPELERIVQTTLTKTDLPFSLKVRRGFLEPLDLIMFAEFLNSVDLLMVTFHPRLAKESYKTPANHEITQTFIELVDHPVVANGSIMSLADVSDVLELTGAAGTMIGRMARRFPWVFNPIYQGGIYSDTYVKSLNHFLDLSKKYGYPSEGFVRGQLMHFLRGFPGAKLFRTRLQTGVEDISQLYGLVDSVDQYLERTGVTSISKVVPHSTT